VSDGIKIAWLPFLCSPAFKLGGFDFPDQDTAIFTAADYNRIVERRPVGIEHRCSMTTSKRDDVRELVREVVGQRAERRGKRQDRESSAS
jgi:hypothetical protein